MVSDRAVILLTGGGGDLTHRHTVDTALSKQFHRRPFEAAHSIGFSFFVQAYHAEGLSSSRLFVKHIIQMI